MPFNAQNLEGLFIWILKRKFSLFFLEKNEF